MREQSMSFDDDAPMTPPDLEGKNNSGPNDALRSLQAPATPPDIDANDGAYDDTPINDDEILQSKKKDAISTSSVPSTSSTIVLDIGSHSCRIGSASYAEPQHIMFSSWRGEHSGANYERRAVQYSSFERGAAWELAMHFDELALDAVLKKCFQKCDVRGKKVLFSESHVRNDALRRYLIESLFDKYEVSDICVQKTPVLHCIALKKISGVVVDIGASLTSVVPVINCVVLDKAAQHSSVAGNALDIALAQHLTSEAGQKNHCGLDLQAIKELYCCCPGGSQYQSHEFEKLFGPVPHKVAPSSVPMLLLPPLLKCLRECTHCMRSLQLPLINESQPGSNIPDALPVLLVGGSSRFRNFKDSFVRACGDHIGSSGIHIGQQSSASESTSPSGGAAASVHLPTAESCEHTAWLGGRYLASSSEFQLPWLSSVEYKEKGIEAAARFFG